MRLFLIALVAVAGLTLGCAQNETVETDTVVTVTLKNIGASAWQVVAADEESVAEFSVDNPALTLTVGTRYLFDLSAVNSDVHPLEFRNAEDERLLTQGGSEGSFETDEAVAFEANADSLAFTLTPDLAAALASYRCTVHSGMTGSAGVSDE